MDLLQQGMYGSQHAAVQQGRTIWRLRSSCRRCTSPVTISRLGTAFQPNACLGSSACMSAGVASQPYRWPTSSLRRPFCHSYCSCSQARLPCCSPSKCLHARRLSLTRVLATSPGCTGKVKSHLQQARTVPLQVCCCEQACHNRAGRSAGPPAYHVQAHCVDELSHLISAVACARLDFNHNRQLAYAASSSAVQKSENSTHAMPLDPCPAGAASDIFLRKWLLPTSRACMQKWVSSRMPQGAPLMPSCFLKYLGLPLRWSA